MANALAFSVFAFGCHIQVSAECREAYSVLDRYVWPNLPRASSVQDAPDIAIRIENSSAPFRLLIDNAFAAFSDEAIGLVPSIVNAIDEAVIQRLTTLRAVHAGAVLWKGRVLLLPGGTHAGKSSLVAELLRRGAEYFSDEYALIDNEGRAHAYPRPLMIRNGSIEQVPVLPSEFRASVGEGPAPVGWILSLQFQSGGRWNIGEVAQSIGLLDLLRNTPHVLTDSPEVVEAFQHAVEGAVCYSGDRGDAADAAQQILSLIGGSA